jgi:hypothetical protein
VDDAKLNGSITTRCPADHDTEVWPYVARCILNAGHVPTQHKDKHGKVWTD